MDVVARLRRLTHPRTAFSILKQVRINVGCHGIKIATCGPGHNTIPIIHVSQSFRWRDELVQNTPWYPSQTNWDKTLRTVNVMEYTKHHPIMKNKWRELLICMDHGLLSLVNILITTIVLLHMAMTMVCLVLAQLHVLRSQLIRIAIKIRSSTQWAWFKRSTGRLHSEYAFFQFRFCRCTLSAIARPSQGSWLALFSPRQRMQLACDDNVLRAAGY